MLISRPLPPDTDLLALHRVDPGRYRLLLQSVAHGTAQARWDLLLLADGGSLTLGRDGVTRDASGAVVPGTFLQALDAAWRAGRLPREEPRWPFRGGWALLLCYELARQLEPVLVLPDAPGGLPVAQALRCPAAVLRDHASGTCVAVAEDGHGGMLDRVERDLAAAGSLPAWPAWAPPAAVHEDPAGDFAAGVARVLDYLAAGDVFQANLSRAWRAEFAAALDPARLYARMREASPAPFSGLYAGDGWAVASASPERLVSIRGDLVETRPIAGTRPRVPGDDDEVRVRELIGHPKERAEHVMLVDLERNDLGRVCVPGSVEVDELMAIESYAHVHHIVSNVRGRLRADAGPCDVVVATFPGGTITGCPKVRCMQVIAELEGTGRGSYTGAMGWLNRDGDLDLNILIRSAEVEGAEVRFRTGAGIVADSDPVRELEETRAKARGLLQALAADPGGATVS
ncbi:aminodeoxychorismate synthase component I [Luteimonas wenzhouensis]|uniref:Aminodeoxychorismate synthase component I n=1 Tax=Luteimonas wenzhouensis TaxID=2599615 RepID=A0A5C5U336_9GAMM|nr:aminodeoxychorismate synthase component I [Luteimonas wenzhouensis]TWT20823.1 aminodeoxychorismate synthase component I [Luteimonas wenzhouensis]